MQIKSFGLVSYRNNFTGPGAGLTQISQQISYRIIPKLVPSPAAAITIDTTVFNFFTLRTKLLHADELRHMFFCSVRIPIILRGLKIIKYILYIVRVSREKVSGLIKHRCHTSSFWSQISQYRLLHSRFPCVTWAPHLGQHRLRSQMDFFLEVLCG